MVGEIFMSVLAARATLMPAGSKRTAESGLSLFISSSERVPVHEGLARADAQGLIVASRFDWATKKGAEDALPAITGTAYAYAEPGKTFREAAKRIASLGGGYFVDAVFDQGGEFQKSRFFPVPEEHLDHSGLLVMNHPDYTIHIDISGEQTYVPRPGAVIDLLDLPTTSGLYHIPDPKYGIGQGKAVPGHVKGVVMLVRIARAVGNITVGKLNFDHFGSATILYDWVSGPYGMATSGSVGPAAPIV
ncbi:hypothetical protein HY988_06540 [Candidatus Micrarchaeota archaeon]|nr:hypothetical protein [Candidatus Micrarchaeota archaeon]